MCGSWSGSRRETALEPLDSVKLSVSQSDLLRHLTRQSGPVPLDHVDGRVVRALKRRGLVEVRGDWVTATHAGRAVRDQALSPLSGRPRRRRHVVSAVGARAQSILKAADELERALPINAEVDLSGFRAYGDDIVTGLRQFARQMDRG